jgi:predicted kinase
MAKGFPASGKSTWALKEAEADGTIRVNKDDLRRMLHNDVWNKSNEKQTLWMRDAIIREGLKRGLHVIVDDTNLAPQHEKQVRKLANGSGFNVRTFFDVSYEELLRRDADREHPVGKAVIDKMVKQWEKWKDEPTHDGPHPVFLPIGDQNASQRQAIIVDIDGTLADHEGIRSPYDSSRVHLDRPIGVVCDLVRLLIPHYRILFFSGREDSCRDATWGWLVENVIYGYEDQCELHMRKAGDKRKDDLVKSELFDNHARKYYVDFVIDDRKQVKRMWNKRGLFVFDVNQTDEEF